MIKVKVPATSANMGPGFDAMGIALNLYNYLYIEEIHEGLSITGCPTECANENNLVYQSMMHLFKHVGYSSSGLNIRFESHIPMSRGLGSSASCILGGVLAANSIAGQPLNQRELLELAADIEGHPDNIAPALLGGMVISIMDGRRVLSNKVRLHPGLKFCALIPDFTLSTQESRGVLPKMIPYGDAVFNVSRSSLFVSALVNGNFGLIQYACQDRLHQPYRGPLVDGFESIIRECDRLDCLGVYLSGAGPTIMVILREEDDGFIPNINRYLSTLGHGWKSVELQEDPRGATLEIL